MDTQLKKGILDVCVLTVLQKGESYGYNIIKELVGVVDISESTLYPILKRLESSDCLTSRRVEHSGRLRKYYKITISGRQKIADFTEEWGEIMKIYQYIKGETHND